MTINIARFYKREKLELDCEIITPMFLGNASQEAELRAAPFKGLLRYWWRVAEGGKYATPEKLLAAENALFGSPDEKTGGKSQVVVEVTAISNMMAKKDNFQNPGLVDHPECERSNKKTNPLNYLAGMGLIHYRDGISHDYFPPTGKFRLTITCSPVASSSVQATLLLLDAFGAIGSRNRNGWGCFGRGNTLSLAGCSFRNFLDAFDRDYPHCLGKDSQGPLLWQTDREAYASWPECMKALAEVYISIRAGNESKGIPKLNVTTGNPPERHLLGYPVTNHPIATKNWGNQGRHGSALRLIVRKDPDGHRGYILHLPHLFSKEMWPGGKEQQIAIWQKVHNRLDTLCQRVTTEARP